MTEGPRTAGGVTDGGHSSHACPPIKRNAGALSRDDIGVPCCGVHLGLPATGNPCCGNDDIGVPPSRDALGPASNGGALLRDAHVFGRWTVRSDRHGP
jgi:hypothetical protein